MIPRWYARSQAFALPDAGSDYFTTVAHYQSFASRTIAALRGFTVVVVTGDPPPFPQILYTALTAGAASQYAVTGLSCGPELGRDELLRASHVLLDPSTGARTTSGDPPRPSPAPPLLVFDDAAQLSDEQIELIFENVSMSTRRGDHRNTAAVLLARPNFLARFDDMSAKNRVGGGSRSYMFSCAADCDLGGSISRPRRPTSIGTSVVDSQRSSLRLTPLAEAQLAQKAASAIKARKISSRFLVRAEFVCSG
jgi:hypothetical protein